MMSALPLASVRLSTLRILCLSDLQMEIYVKKNLYFHIFFWFSNSILSDALILSFYSYRS